MKRKKLIIGSRASKLALIYANRVKDEISKYFNQEIIIKKITTKGDTKIDIRLSEIGGKGLFSKNIEEELLKKLDELQKNEDETKNKADNQSMKNFMLKHAIGSTGEIGVGVNFPPIDKIPHTPVVCLKFIMDPHKGSTDINNVLG